MKALILAAGFGSRLLPYTKIKPKPLFTINNRTILDIIICNLQNIGCNEIIINTHHLYEQIDYFVKNRTYLIPVHTCYEPEILGTGGAVKNVGDFFNEHPFIVINSDIVTDIDLKNIYDFHLNHNCPVTMVLHDYSAFNKVSVDQNGFITGFHGKDKKDHVIKLAFTGIQILSPFVLDFIPDNSFANIIDVYKKLITKGYKIKSCIVQNHYWSDIGTINSYRKTVYHKMADKAFRKAFPFWKNKKITRIKLQGDGSSRMWYRITSCKNSLIMVDHGLKNHNNVCEADSYVKIGQHLYKSGLPVPEICLYDTFSGLVFMEDLGDINLQEIVLNTRSINKVITLYKSVIDLMIKLSLDGIKGFDPLWAYQTCNYNHNLILEKECRYFVESYLCNYLGKNVCFEDYRHEFEQIAANALKHSNTGFMHRDMQSRNIMVKNSNIFFIDFQGGRIGPFQYDLSSLLIDPYVKLSDDTQNLLLDYAMFRLSSYISIETDRFLKCYKYCSITRNFQILGAFGYLSCVKKKVYFEKYIPCAVSSLKRNLLSLESKKYPGLTKIANMI